jgi:sugar phosphate isomerase/epimerase
MQHVLSTHLFVQQRLTVAMLDRIHRAGIPQVEIFCARQHLDYRNKEQVAELAHWFRDSQLRLHSLHAPMYNDDIWGRTGPHSIINIAETTKSKRIQMVDEIKRALEIAELIPCRYVIQHLGVGGEEYDERKIDAAFSSLEELSLFARQRGVDVILENTPNDLSRSDRLMLFLDQTHLDLGFCFDIGHAHIMEGVETAFDTMKARIRSTHLHDNDGKADQHLFPMADGGTIDWKKAMKLLGSRAEQYPLLLELRDPETTNPLDQVMATFERLEEMAARRDEE